MSVTPLDGYQCACVITVKLSLRLLFWPRQFFGGEVDRSGGGKGLSEGTLSTMKLVADDVQGVIIPDSCERDGMIPLRGYSGCW